jgi:hypothetical protein
MRKFLASAMAALTFGGAVAATATPAAAHDYYYRHRHHSGDTAAVAAVAGIAGLAIGAALADGGSSRSRGYYSGYSYDPRYDRYGGGYYGRGYYYDDDYYRPRICISRERVWDPYIGRHVSIERRYRC